MKHWDTKTNTPRVFIETAGILHEVSEDPTRFRVERLATYNGECQRGLVHAEGWDIFMRQEQKWFNSLHPESGGNLPIRLSS